jgi:hypothetical protein
MEILEVSEYGIQIPEALVIREIQDQPGKVELRDTLDILATLDFLLDPLEIRAYRDQPDSLVQAEQLVQLDQLVGQDKLDLPEQLEQRVQRVQRVG